jgi:hypothetical protein
VSVQFTIPGRPTAWQRAREFVHRQSGKIVRSNPPEMKVQQDTIRWAFKVANRGGPAMVGAQIVQDSFGKRYGHPERTEVRLTEVDALCDHSPKAAFVDALAMARGQDSLPGLGSNPCNTQSGRRG